MLLPTLSRIVALIGMLCLSATARADVFVVAAASGPLQAISPKELQALYMGKRQELGDGQRVQATDLPREHPLRERFYNQLTGMSVAQVNSHWSRLLFSGRSTPPTPLSNEEAMLNYLLRTPAALGYTANPPPSGLKVVMVLKTSPANPQGHAP